jgi:NodT family efflux transporter outer membrane factor (OMF) lipoprotein
VSPTHPSPASNRIHRHRAATLSLKGGEGAEHCNNSSRLFRHFLIFALAPLLAGCTVGPDFVAPQADTPNQWTKTATPAHGVDNAPADPGAWWSNFHDPVLTSLIGRAAQSNLDIQEAALRIAESRANLAITESAEWPTLGGNASYTRQRFSTTTAQGSLFNSIGNIGIKGVSLPAFPNPYNQFQTGFDASWEPDLFGGVRRSIEASQADTLASIEDGRNALVSLEGEIARSYIDLRGAQLKRGVARANLKTDRDVLTLARQRRKAGVVTDLDVSNASAQVTNTQSQIPALDRTIALDINQLSQLLALEPGALETELKGERPVPSIAHDITIGLPGDLLRRRPDIREAEERLHAATARVGVATADLFPKLTFDASFGTQSATPLGLASWASRFFSIGPSLDIPIFEGGKLRAQVHLADVQEKEAAVDYAKAVLGAVHEVENALVAYKTEQDRRRDLAATEKENRDALTLARQRYQSGVTTFIDVLDAERTLEATQASLADSTVQLSTDLVALYKALGGGWNDETKPSQKNIAQ